MISYRIELSGTADEADFGKVQDAFRASVLKLRDAGVTVGGQFTGSDSLVKNSGVSILAGDVDKELTDQEKAIRKAHAASHKARIDARADAKEAAEDEAKADDAKDG